MSPTFCCNEECYSCKKDDLNFCLSCKGIRYMHPHLPKCLLKCPDGYYGSNSTNKCEKCHDTCASCSGPLINNCLTW